MGYSGGLSELRWVSFGLPGFQVGLDGLKPDMCNYALLGSTDLKWAHMGSHGLKWVQMSSRLTKINSFKNSI